ncbi:MAG TPA: DUF3363 domain-containing protein [Ochrobactrum intermedium]|uniref:DUF3363 domain-containing protein n=1 Tax=Brucella intermedia TaxID=94625 RepID=A0A7V6PFZ7_9HYPH|nr:DUF3363 domain-containing protein [Brucella intermedia]
MPTSRNLSCSLSCGRRSTKALRCETCSTLPKRCGGPRSGEFAGVEQCREFTMVPWRPVIDRQLGKKVSGIVQDRSVSWQFGQPRGLGL